MVEKILILLIHKDFLSEIRMTYSFINDMRKNKGCYFNRQKSALNNFIVKTQVLTRLVCKHMQAFSDYL